MSNPKPKSGPGRGFCVWLREHLRPSAASRVSHTRVKVLSGTTGETWSNPFSRGNTLSTGQGFPGVRGSEVNDKAMNKELVEHCKQHGAVKTFAALGSSGKPSKKNRSFLQRFPRCRGKRRSGKVAPMPDPKVAPCLKNEAVAQKSGAQNLILHNLDEDDYSSSKETELPSSGKVIGEHLSYKKQCLKGSQNMSKTPQGEYLDLKVEDKKLTEKSQERKTLDECLERRTSLRDTGSMERKAHNKRGTSRFLGHGDNRSNTATGFLLQTKPSRRGRHYTHEEKQTRVEIQHFDATAPNRNSKLYDTLKRTENESEDETKLPDLAGGRKSSLEKSQSVKQGGTSTETSEFVGRSHTTKQMRNSEFNTKQDAFKMARPKFWQGVVLNEAIGEKTRRQEECTFFDNTDCSEDNSARGISATGRDKQELRVIFSDPKTKDHVVNIWRNNFNESEELNEEICEGEGFQQSLMKSSSQPASYDIWRRSDDECEKAKLPESVEDSNMELEQYSLGSSSMVLSSKSTYDIWQRSVECQCVLDGSNSSSLSSDFKEQEMAIVEPVNTKPEWFTEYSTKSGESKSARPMTRRGLGATEVTSEGRQAEKFGFLSQETCSGETSVPHQVEGKHFSLKDLGSYCCPETTQLHADIWINDFGESDEVGKSDVETNQEGVTDNLQSGAYQPEKLSLNEGHEASSNIRIGEITVTADSSTTSKELEEFEALEEALEKEELENEVLNDNSEICAVDSAKQELTAKELQELKAKQNEQWELASLGEWSLICHDHEEDEESTDRYLLKDELLKEQEVRQNLDSIIFQFQDLPVMTDFQKMLTLPGCPEEQIKRALRQYARICRGPVPLSESGQSKAEAVASISVSLHCQTKRFLQEPQSSFRVFARIMEELDILRERQDSVEISLRRNLRIGVAGKQVVRTSRSGRWSADPRDLPWKLNRRLIDTYMSQTGIKSSCRVDLMSSIPE